MANTGNSQNTHGFPVVSAPGKVPVVTSIFDFSADALAQLRLWLEQNPPAIGISNILGFAQFTAQIASEVDTAETSSSTSYTDLATVGPTLTGLPDGQYLILYAFAGSSSATAVSTFMNVSLNGAAISGDTAAAITPAGVSNASSMSWTTTTLSNGGNNTVTAKYRVNGVATGTFFNRRLVAFKYANK